MNENFENLNKKNFAKNYKNEFTCFISTKFPICVNRNPKISFQLKKNSKC